MEADGKSSGSSTRSSARAQNGERGAATGGTEQEGSLHEAQDMMQDMLLNAADLELDLESESFDSPVSLSETTGLQHAFRCIDSLKVALPLVDEQDTILFSLLSVTGDFYAKVTSHEEGVITIFDSKTDEPQFDIMGATQGYDTTITSGDDTIGWTKQTSLYEGQDTQPTYTVHYDGQSQYTVTSNGDLSLAAFIYIHKDSLEIIFDMNAIASCKALVLTYAISCAFLEHRGRMKEELAKQRIQQASPGPGLTPSDLPVLQSMKTVSIIASSNANNAPTFVVMDRDVDNNVVLFIKYKQDQLDNIIEASDVSDIPMFTATQISPMVGNDSTVTFRGHDIGTIKTDDKTAIALITAISDQQQTFSVISKVQSQYEVQWNGKAVALIDNEDSPAAATIRFVGQDVDMSAKQLIITFAFKVVINVYKLHEKPGVHEVFFSRDTLAGLRIPPFVVIDPPNLDAVFDPLRKTIVLVAGYSQAKGIEYFDVMYQEEQTIAFTWEWNPEKRVATAFDYLARRLIIATQDRQLSKGINVVSNDGTPVGSLLTGLGTFALSGGYIVDPEGYMMFEIAMHHQQFYYYDIVDTRGAKAAEIYEEDGTMRVVTFNETLAADEKCLIQALAIQIYCTVFRKSMPPLPHIRYAYSGQNQSGKFLAA